MNITGFREERTDNYFMDLKELRGQIDSIDNELLELYAKRMELCLQVAEYKAKNKVSVMQSGREKEILDRVQALSPERFSTGAEVLFTDIMDISKSYQDFEINRSSDFEEYGDFAFDTGSRIGCYGVKGSNSEEAAFKIFGKRKMAYYHEFEDIFKAVESGELDYGVVPVQNSNTGSISQTYDLMKKYNVYINRMTRVSVNHCLASSNAASVSDVKTVYSNPQAIMQCSDFLQENDLRAVQFASTAASAKYAAKSERKIAAICSERCARLYKLNILAKNISNSEQNFTRFICISGKFLKEKDADHISVQLSLPDEKGSLSRMLTKFRVAGLNLLKLESRPQKKGNFDVDFYLDFEGSTSDEKVAALLKALSTGLSDFKFLGNYSEIY